MQETSAMPQDICLVGSSTEEIADPRVVAIGSDSRVLEIVCEKIWPEAASLGGPNVLRRLGLGLKKVRDWARTPLWFAIHPSSFRVALKPVDENNAVLHIESVGYP
jgi:hypothetical protein